MSFKSNLKPKSDHQLHLEIYSCNLSLGARVSAKNRGDDTPLHNSAQNGHVSVSQCLIKNKAQVNSQNEHGNSPLHYACFSNHTEGKFLSNLAFFFNIFF